MSTTPIRTTGQTTIGREIRPLAALARAEFAQFVRNRTLVFMGVAFPIGLPLMTYFIGRGEGATAGELAFTVLEMFALVALLFVQYYSVLSMVTTRRGEGVLRRLRTGEAADWHILTAPAVPGAILTLVGSIATVAVVYATGAPAPENALGIVLAIAGGLVLFSALALATAAYTKDAEAAQVTSLPVMAVAFLGMSNIRTLLPERYAEIADYTPFAGISDLLEIGTVGQSGGMIEQLLPPLGIIVAWTAIALYAAKRSFRWDDRR